ncbi:MAG: mechanosensitive ion channel family protein [Aquificaceae bacterium]|nr:mechanosensitive ion channel family protein [Aquificaceae bacterium]
MESKALNIFLIISLPVVGFLVEKLLIKRLIRLAKRTEWEWDDLLISSIRFMPTFWLLLISVYLITESLEISQKLKSTLHKSLILLAIMSVALFLSRVVGEFITLYMKRYREDMPATSLIGQISRIFVLLVGLIISLDKIGIAITPLLTALGVGGLAVALAVRDTLENLFAGFHILANKQIKPGDYIKLQSGEEGYVEDITWRNTIIRQIPNNFVIVPNSKISTAIVINYNLPQPEMNTTVTVSVAYENDLEKVEKVTLETAREVQREVQYASPDFEPRVRFTSFGEYSINLNITLRAKDFESQHILRHEFIKRLKKAYDREGIKIPAYLQKL